MLPENQNNTNQAVDAAQLGNLTRSQLKKLETKEKTAWQKAWETQHHALCPDFLSSCAHLKSHLWPLYWQGSFLLADISRVP